MNPSTILIAIVAALAIAAGAYTVGRGHGINAQKVADQAQFDAINRGIEKQKADANALYRTAQADIIALQAERDRFKTQLEKNREQDRTATDAARDRLAGFGLRFRPQQAGGSGQGCPGTLPGSPNPAGAASAPVVELPAALARRLRSIAHDADQLADDYRQCYGYALGVK